MQEVEYTQVVNESSKNWASGFLTRIEQIGLFVLRREKESWTAAKEALLAGADYLVEEVLDLVMESDFVEAAIKHGCPVAWRLYEDRENRPLREVVWSYATKNKVFRYFAHNMRKTNPTLLEAWKGEEAKQEGEVGSEPLIRPKSLSGDPVVLKGIEKLECYWPCQLLRYLESIRLRKNEPILRLINPAEDQEKDFAIMWSEFDTVIAKSSTLSDFAVNVAVKTVQILLRRNVRVEQVSNVLLAGYSPNGPLKEHGQERKVNEIWTQIFKKLEETIPDFANSELRCRLLIGVGDLKEGARFSKDFLGEN
jgi:hypothetical protein